MNIIVPGLATSLRLVDETYKANDPIGPLSLSSWQAPPVKNVVAIYGINVPTEVCGVYRRNPAGVRISAAALSLEQLFVLDKEAKLSKRGSESHVMKDGVILETKDTPQDIIGSSGGGGGVQKKSGDGTVAYWSLQHCRAVVGVQFQKPSSYSELVSVRLSCKITILMMPMPVQSIQF